VRCAVVSVEGAGTKVGGLEGLANHVRFSDP